MKNTMALLNEKLLNGFLNKLYPIGKTEFFLDNEDHSNYMGFTWQLDCKGRVPVGLDTNDTDFDTIGKTGGEKTHTLTINEMPSHNHIARSQVGSGVGDGMLLNGNSYTVDNNYKTGSTGGSQAHNNIQPYKVFAI